MKNPLETLSEPRIGCVQHDCDNCKANAERIARLEAENETLQLRGQELAGEVEALKADAERLDWLTEQGQKTTFNWFARDSLVNRGYRLHQGHGVGSATPRAAIDAARSK